MLPGLLKWGCQSSFLFFLKTVFLHFLFWSSLRLTELLLLSEKVMQAYDKNSNSTKGDGMKTKFSHCVFCVLPWRLMVCGVPFLPVQRTPLKHTCFSLRISRKTLHRRPLCSLHLAYLWGLSLSVYADLMHIFLNTRVFYHISVISSATSLLMVFKFCFFSDLAILTNYLWRHRSDWCLPWAPPWLGHLKWLPLLTAMPPAGN